MKHINNYRSIVFKSSIIAIVFVIIAAVLFSAQRVLAQNPAPDGPLTAPSTTSNPSVDSGDGLIEVDVPVTMMGEGGDGLPAGVSPAAPNVAPSGILAADEILASFSYYRLVGTAFNPRTSSTTFAYNFEGCIYETGGADNRFMAPLLIPENSIIKYLRLYYNDTNAGSSITAYLTRYQPGVTNEDLTFVNSAGSSGYGTTLSEEITHTVNIHDWAYTIIIAPNGNSSANSFCGVRVAYFAPNSYAVAVPVILK